MHVWTYAIILTVTLGVSAYTAAAAANGVSGDTISAVLRTIARDWWIVAWLWAVLGGHWFLGYPEAITTPERDAVILVWLTLILFIVNLAHFRMDWPGLPTWGYAVILAVGTAAGHFLWSQAGTHSLY